MPASKNMTTPNARIRLPTVRRKTGSGIRRSSRSPANVSKGREVLTLPSSAVVTEGDVNIGYKNYCYIVEEGRVRRTQIEIGAKGGHLVEVLKKQVPAASASGQPPWAAFSGTEAVVQGDLARLKDGQAVTVGRGQ
jgi:hypothetical protein